MNIISTLKVMDYHSYHYSLEEAYDLQMGIYLDYDNLSIQRPYAVIAYHPVEECLSGTLLDRWIRRFMELNIGESLGLTFGEFLRMDMESVILVYHNAKAMARLKSNSIEEAKEQLDNIEKQKQT